MEVQKLAIRQGSRALAVVALYAAATHSAAENDAENDAVFNANMLRMSSHPICVLPPLLVLPPQEIGNLLYGYGQLHFQHPGLLDAVASACGPRLHEFTTQDLCMTVWAYGAVGYCPADTTLFESACRVLLQRKERLVPLQITCVIKGFSRAGYQPPAAFMQQMSQLAQVKLSQFSPLEYSQLLWAYSTAGYRDVQLFETVVAHAIQQLHTKTHLVTKTTVDTMLVACQGVGFWPQLLVDTAEINGLYVRTQQQIVEGMEPLAAPVIAAADAASAAAQATAAAAAAALAAADAKRLASADPAVAAASVGSLAHAAAEQDGASHSGSSSSSVVADAIAEAFGVAVEEQFEVPRQLLQQQSLSPRQQASRLDGYGLQRPQLPPLRQQQHGQLEQQQPPAAQQQQQQQGLDHPLLRSHLMPPPALPKHQQQRHSGLPAAAVGSMAHTNGTSHNHSQQHSEHSSSSSSSSQGLLYQAHSHQQQQQHHGDALVHPLEQL